MWQRALRWFKFKTPYPLSGNPPTPLRGRHAPLRGRHAGTKNRERLLHSLPADWLAFRPLHRSALGSHPCVALSSSRRPTVSHVGDVVTDYLAISYPSPNPPPHWIPFIPSKPGCPGSTIAHTVPSYGVKSKVAIVPSGFVIALFMDIGTPSPDIPNAPTSNDVEPGHTAKGIVPVPVSFGNKASTMHAPVVPVGVILTMNAPRNGAPGVPGCGFLVFFRLRCLVFILCSVLKVSDVFDHPGTHPAFWGLHLS